MRRRMLLGIIGALAMLVGTPSLASAAPTGNVSHISIDHGSFRMKGCDENDSILTFAFSSTGMGTVSVTATSPTDIVGHSEQPVDGSTTHVTVPIHDGYVGEVTIAVIAAGYQVAPGHKGDQTAYDHWSTSVGTVNCAMGVPAPSTTQHTESATHDHGFWHERHTWLLLTILAAFVVIVVVIVWRVPLND